MIFWRRSTAGAWLAVDRWGLVDPVFLLEVGVGVVVEELADDPLDRGLGGRPGARLVQRDLEGTGDDARSADAVDAHELSAEVDLLVLREQSDHGEQRGALVILGQVAEDPPSAVLLLALLFLVGDDLEAVVGDEGRDDPLDLGVDHLPVAIVLAVDPDGPLADGDPGFRDAGNAQEPVEELVPVVRGERWGVHLVGGDLLPDGGEVRDDLEIGHDCSMCTCVGGTNPALVISLR